MRALTACFTVVLGLGVAAMAACSSTASDTGTGGTGGSATAGTSAGGTSAGGTAAGGTTAVGAAGDIGAGGDGPTCALLEGDCATCIPSHCADEESACQGEEKCDGALEGDSGFIACVCVEGKTVAECATTLAAVDAMAKAVTDCAKTNCATACGL